MKIARLWHFWVDYLSIWISNATETVFIVDCEKKQSPMKQCRCYGIYREVPVNI